MCSHDNQMNGKQWLDLALWDTSGQNDFDDFRHVAYDDADAAIVCFSINDRTSLNNVSRKWIPELQHRPNIPIILVATKTDLRPAASDLPAPRGQKGQFIDSVEGASVATSIGAMDYVECSSAKDENVNLVFQRTAEVVRRRKQQKKIECSIM